jgi:anthranilate/para-aminobenzoate synthase component II
MQFRVHSSMSICKKMIKNERTKSCPFIGTCFYCQGLALTILGKLERVTLVVQEAQQIVDDR